MFLKFPVSFTVGDVIPLDTVQVLGPLWHFVTRWFLWGEVLSGSVQLQHWLATLWRLSASSYSTYFKL